MKCSGRLDANAAMLAALASGSLGCVPYEAQIRREVQRGDVRTRIESAATKPQKSTEVRLVVQNVPPDVVLLGAAAAALPNAPCGEGPQATKLGRDRGRAVAEPLVRGERIAFEFAPAISGVLAD